MESRDRGRGQCSVVAQKKYGDREIKENDMTLGSLSYTKTATFNKKKLTHTYTRDGDI